ncbi:unnamed protein product, partial [marine sediment metagenome]
MAGDVIWDTIPGGAGAFYTIDYLKNTRDSVLYLTTNYSGGATPDTLPYTIYRKIQGNPHFKEYGNKLYISDSHGFTIVYDDSSYNFICLVDTGFVSAGTATSSSVILHPPGKVHFTYLSNKIYGNANAIFQSTWADKSLRFM